MFVGRPGHGGGAGGFPIPLEVVLKADLKASLDLCTKVVVFKYLRIVPICCLLLRRLCVGKSELLVGRSECGAKNLMLIVLQNQRSRLLYLAEHGLNSPADSDRNSNGKHFPNGKSGNV